mgnify:CR=1 FL=1
MELRIISPQENGFVQEIQWNNEELKTAIAAKMEDYKGLVFTEETIKEGKKDRADLNKLRTAIDNERKRVKKLCMDPYNKFEQQVKEVLGLIDEPIRLIDMQIKEVELAKKEEKRVEVQKLFKTIGFQSFVTLDMIWDEKWLNATVSLAKIEEQMKTIMYQIGDAVLTIHKLPEFSFEAMEIYKKTLNLSQAIAEGQRLADIQKRKEEARIAREKAEGERRKAEEKKAAQEEPEQVLLPVTKEENLEVSVKEESKEAESVLQLDFRVWGTREQLLALRNYMNENHLRFGKVE